MAKAKRKTRKEKAYVCTVCSPGAKAKGKKSCCSSGVLAPEKGTWNA